MNKLVDEYYSSYHRSICKKPIDADYSALTKKIESSHKVSKFKLGDSVRITWYKNIFRNGYTENRSKEIFVINSVLKTNRWTYKTKDLNGEKIIGRFYRKVLLLSNL